jgi:hypothetical protein
LTTDAARQAAARSGHRRAVLAHPVSEAGRAADELRGPLLAGARACCHDELQGDPLSAEGGGHGRGNRYRLREDAGQQGRQVPGRGRVCEFVVLNELDGGRHLLIQIGSAEAFALAASLGDMQWAAR